MFLVSAVPVMVLLGLIRAIALLRRGTGASWRDAVGAFFIWQSTSPQQIPPLLLKLILRNFVSLS